MNYIREFRKSKGLNKNEFSLKIGVTSQFVGMIENGIRKPGLNIQIKIKRAFPNFNVNKLVDEYIERSKKDETAK